MQRPGGRNEYDELKHSGEVSVAEAERAGKRGRKQGVKSPWKIDHLGSISHRRLWVLFLVLRGFIAEF